MLSALGAVLFLDATLAEPLSSLLVGADATPASLVVVGVGQTVGIVNAVVQY